MHLFCVVFELCLKNRVFLGWPRKKNNLKRFSKGLKFLLMKLGKNTNFGALLNGNLHLQPQKLHFHVD